MARIVIKVTAAPGFHGVFRAGRFWPSSGTTVETLTSEDDGPALEDGTLQIGKKTQAAIEADGRFSFGIAGTIEEIEALRSENEQLKARVAELEAAATEAPVKGKRGKAE